MEYRPPDYKNPFIISVLREKPRQAGTITSSEGFTKHKIPDPVYEAGWDTAVEHILSLLKDKARASVIIDILEGRR